MKKTVRVVDGKEINYNCYSKKEKRTIVASIEKDEICIEDAAEKCSVHIDTIKNWIKLYSKILTVTVKRRLSEETKKTIVRDIEAGVLTRHEAMRRFDVQHKAIQEWMEKYSVYDEKPQKSGYVVKNDKLISKEIANLKLKVTALETMIDVAEKELNIDIRKKHGTKRSL
jgi:transposase